MHPNSASLNHASTFRRYLPQSKTTADTDWDDGSLERAMRSIGAVVSYPRRTAVVHEHDPADRLFKVISGAVCTYKILSDGRRQIGGFYLPGDIFGLESNEGHVLAAETITNAKILVIRKNILATLANRSAAITLELLELTARELARAQDRVLLLSSKSAQERIIGFLFEMSKRASSSGSNVNLPMSRQDIADYLGLTIETVSRTLWALENSGAIEIFARRQISFRNRSALALLQH
jgi:CRP-like cAMP-binding protein